MPLPPAYQDALDYIYSFVDYSKTHAANLAPENFDLRRMVDLLQRLGDPHTRYPAIHIAGTKGKGSTAALCSAALSASSLTTGLYTSPHLEDYAERMMVDGRPIPHTDLVRLVEAIRPHVASVPGVSTFEITTALAFMYFAERQVDVAVLEVGLGGRLDATNVVTPLVSVITAISLDHVPILGSTLPEIAAEKGGIIKTGVPVVVARQQPVVMDTLREIARERHAPLIAVDDVTQCLPLSASLAGQKFSIRSEYSENTEIIIPLLGDHQIENAAAAWTALQVARRRGLAGVTNEAIVNGFAGVHWPGRFEVLQHDPLIILDAAHNPDSARRLFDTCRAYLPDRPVRMIFGASGDKDMRAFLETFRPVLVKLYATRSTHPRATPPDRIADQTAELDIPTAVTGSIEEALEAAQQDLQPDDVLLVTGSVFVVGAARAVYAEMGRGDL